MVLTELLQNAVDHGFPEGSSGGDVVVQLNPADDHLNIRVINDGRGLDSQFELNKATGLGLSIVRTLVTTELAGSILMRAGTPEDFASAGLGRSAQGCRHRRRPHGADLTTGRRVRRLLCDGRRTAGEAPAALPRRCRPRSRSPGWSPRRSRGSRVAQGTAAQTSLARAICNSA